MLENIIMSLHETVQTENLIRVENVPPAGNLSIAKTTAWGENKPKKKDAAYFRQIKEAYDK